MPKVGFAIQYSFACESVFQILITTKYWALHMCSFVDNILIYVAQKTIVKVSLYSGKFYMRSSCFACTLRI